MTALIAAYLAAGVAMVIWVNTKTTRGYSGWALIRDQWRKHPVATVLGIGSAHLAFIVCWPLVVIGAAILKWLR